ncbi:OsmC family protein [Ornithinicoccus hortensis]|uniref:Osmotically inducible protein OsmC n=2 Tax=Ornithinicoccus hortensis TaxID=82346 RepID=A0A542YVM4_9MICO|nr:osmotically inducible protein OsmC [Ornithinicoccus hortensis]
MQMSIAERSTRTTWTGPLASGSGTLDGGSSQALDGQEVTWAARTEAPGGKTSPEELAAAAHSSCFSMALALKLGENQTPPGRLEVDCTVTLDAVDGVPTITTSALTVKAQVDELDADRFAAIVDEAAALCPVSRLFTGAEVSVQAELVQG